MLTSYLLTNKTKVYYNTTRMPCLKIKKRNTIFFSSETNLLSRWGIRILQNSSSIGTESYLRRLNSWSY